MQIKIGNPDNLKKLILALELEETELGGQFIFEMSSFADEIRCDNICTTAACIAGVAAILALETDDNLSIDDDPVNDIRLYEPTQIMALSNHFLGITGSDRDIAHDLIYYPSPDTTGVDHRDIDRTHAIEMLRNLQKRGVIDWSFHPDYEAPDHLMAIRTTVDSA